MYSAVLSPAMRASGFKHPRGDDDGQAGGGCGGGAVLGTFEVAAEADNLVRRPNSRNV